MCTYNSSITHQHFEARQFNVLASALAVYGAARKQLTVFTWVIDRKAKQGECELHQRNLRALGDIMISLTETTTNLSYLSKSRQMIPSIKQIASYLAIDKSFNLLDASNLRTRTEQCYVLLHVGAWRKFVLCAFVRCGNL